MNDPKKMARIAQIDEDLLRRGKKGGEDIELTPEEDALAAEARQLVGTTAGTEQER